MRDRICVSRYYPVEYIKPNRMYIVRWCNYLFIANGNIYIHIRKDDDFEKDYYCSINNFKKWGGIENLKSFISFKGKKEKVKTISDLIDAVLECGYKRELDNFEMTEIQEDSLLKNSNYKYSICDLKFHRCENFFDGFLKAELQQPKGMITDINRNKIIFYLDLGINGIRKDLPESLLHEIECEANELLEANFVKPEDIKNMRFTCYLKVEFSHYYHYGQPIISYGKVNHEEKSHHTFYRSYRIFIEIDKINDYYNDFELDNNDINFLKRASFCLCDESPEVEKAVDEFVKNEMFNRMRG